MPATDRRRSPGEFLDPLLHEHYDNVDFTSCLKLCETFQSLQKNLRFWHVYEIFIIARCKLHMNVVRAQIPFGYLSHVMGRCDSTKHFFIT